MLKQTSKEFRILFLEKFTNELIKNSSTAETIAIRKRLKEKIKEFLITSNKKTKWIPKIIQVQKGTIKKLEKINPIQSRFLLLSGVNEKGR
ncbi:MAG: hypothetical protein KGD67_13090 [Candidatus Lokiarchaeota archaeon]|nr:hypothetical protein [Candidatus Lokiarchaeota archaeon]